MKKTLAWIKPFFLVIVGSFLLLNFFAHPQQTLVFRGASLGLAIACYAAAGYFVRQARIAKGLQ